MSKRKRINPVLRRKDRKVLKRIALTLGEEKCPIDIGHIKRTLENAVGKKLKGDPPNLVEGLLQGDFGLTSNAEDLWIGERIKLSELRDKQTQGVKDFREKMNIIKPFLNQFINGTCYNEPSKYSIDWHLATYSIDWYPTCIKISEGMQKDLDNTYKISDTSGSLRKLVRSWKIAEGVYSPFGPIKHLLLSIGNEIKTFLREERENK